MIGRFLIALVLLSMLIGAAIGLGIGYWLWHQPEQAAVIEAPRPAIIQADGSVVLERKPIAETEADRTAKHKIPDGAKTERQTRVVVQPEPITDNDGCSCEPIAIDLSVIRHDDGSSGVVASSDGGTIDVVNSIDKPVISSAKALSRNRLDMTMAGRDRFSVAFMREYRPLDIPVSLGPAVIRYDGDTSIAIGLSIALP